MSYISDINSDEFAAYLNHNDPIPTTPETPPSSPTLPEIGLEQAMKIVAQYAADQAHIHRIRAAFQKNGIWNALGLPAPIIKKEGPPPAFPPSNSITAIQTAIFDNWPSGWPVKNIPSRFGAAIEIWTAKKDDIDIKRLNTYQFKTQCTLMDAKNLRNQIKILRKPRTSPLDEIYLARLEGLVAVLEAHGGYIGLINTNIDNDNSEYKRGRYYHSHQFIYIKIDNGEVTDAKLMLEKDGDPIDLAPFDPRDAAGKLHGKKVILQSRHDLCDFSTTWRTNKPV